MPKKKEPESREAQSTRFRVEVERLAAGKLNPTEAYESLDRIVRCQQGNSKRT